MSGRLTYVGHGSVLLEVGGTRLLTDPVLRTRIVGFITRVPGGAPAPPRGVDAVLISHPHADHLDYPSLRRVGRDVPVVVPRGCGWFVRARGLRDVREVEAGEEVRIGNARVVATPARHDGRRWPVGRRRPALGYEVRASGLRVYYPGDTDLFDEMAELAGVDVALLPIGAWGGAPGKGHLDGRRAAEAAARLRARLVVPVHWGTYARADLHRRNPAVLERPPAELRRHLGELAPASELRVLAPGEALALPVSS